MLNARLQSQKQSSEKEKVKKLQSAARKKFINLFISRLNLSTIDADEQESIVDAFVNDDGAHIYATHVNCSKLDRKHDSYASFCVSVTVNVNIFQHVFGVLNSADTWAERALICRFYPPRLS